MDKLNIVLRAYTHYVHQLLPEMEFVEVEKILEKHKKVILKNFENRFSPLVKKRNYEEVVLSDKDAVVVDIMNYLLSCASVRTNFFVKDDNHPLSIKFLHDHHKAPLVIGKSVVYETLMYDEDLLALHLRNDKVARGGVRHSDTPLYLRRDLNNLLNTQCLKNVVVVPSGAKGGFTLLNNPKPNLEEIKKAYSKMIEGLLSVVDNKNTKLSKDMIVYDDEDSYLVVAADKGTGSFSDIANEIALAHKFWLGDAFASGGSQGYSHKEMGITSKGAWVSLKNHSAGYLNVNDQAFTAVGVGDMSGDVFGNGMLLSQTIRLIGAFNHGYIFVDPNPEMAVSFNERLRLFTAPLEERDWNYYNQNLISKGGGVFSRGVDKIIITPEMQRALDIEAKFLSPDELIKAILCAPVDIMWLGGIGTFVTGVFEQFNDDPQNANLRVNSANIRCAAVIEGANLGFTQQARIEYAKTGGKINTDAIDNSAGVDCSDHEVNLKILFSALISKKKLKLEERNKILKEATQEVEHSILKNNFHQNRIITIMEYDAVLNHDDYAKLVRIINRFYGEEVKIDEKLSRPECAVLLSYSKRFLKENLMKMDFDYDNDIFEDILFDYFISSVRNNYPDAIKTHALKKAIICNTVTNQIINYLGPVVLTQVFNMNNLQDKAETGKICYELILKYMELYKEMDLAKVFKDCDELNFQKAEILYAFYKEICEAVYPQLIK